MTLATIVALAAALIATPIIRRVLTRYDVVDVPNIRSSHTGVVARGGGLAVVVATAIGIAVSPVEVDQPLLGLGCAALLLGAIGFIDDRRGLRATARLAAQFVVPVLALPLLLDGATNDGIAPVVGVALAVVWSVGYVNAFNFMDGINGISAAQAVVAGGVLAWQGDAIDHTLLTAGGLVIAAACLGFAPFNVWRTSVFLGDVGSYFIGSWLASLVVVAVANDVDPLVAISPFLLYATDTATTIVRRAARGESLMSAHREHAYQRLVQHGWSHLTVAALAGGVMIATSGVTLAAESLSNPARVSIFAATLAGLLGFTALPEVLDRRRHP